MAYIFISVSPGHQSADLGPSALCNEETNDGVGHGAPGFTDEQHHGGLDSVDLEREEGDNTQKQ